ARWREFRSPCVKTAAYRAVSESSENQDTLPKTAADPKPPHSSTDFYILHLYISYAQYKSVTELRTAHDLFSFKLHWPQHCRRDGRASPSRYLNEGDAEGCIT